MFKWQTLQCCSQEGLPAELTRGSDELDPRLTHFHIMFRTWNRRPFTSSPSRAPVRSRPALRRGAVAVEAAIVLPILVAIMMGVWELGRIIQVSSTLTAAAREGARLAAGGANNGVSMTVSMVQDAVRNHLTAAGFPSVAVSGAIIQVTNLSSNVWTDPGEGEPLDSFRVTVTIPPGEAFNSLHWVACTLTGLTQLSAQVEWKSANDAEVVVSSGIPL